MFLSKHDFHLDSVVKLILFCVRQCMYKLIFMHGNLLASSKHSKKVLFSYLKSTNPMFCKFDESHVDSNQTYLLFSMIN